MTKQVHLHGEVLTNIIFFGSLFAIIGSIIAGSTINQDYNFVKEYTWLFEILFYIAIFIVFYSIISKITK